MRIDALKIFKITDRALSPDEEYFGVTKVEPILGALLSSTAYFSKVLPYYNQSGKLLTPAELGCALSHISIYNTIKDIGEGAIIFEADIEPSAAQLRGAIGFCSKTDADFLHMGWHPDVENNVYFKGSKTRENNLYVIEPQHNFYGAFAYFVSVRMAKELIKYHSNSIKLADSWATFFLQSDVLPLFYPIFTHPPSRNEMHQERIQLSYQVYSLSAGSLMFYIKKLFFQKLALLKFWKKSIKPFHNKDNK